MSIGNNDGTTGCCSCAAAWGRFVSALEVYGLPFAALFEGSNHAPVVPASFALVLKDATLKDPHSESSPVGVVDTAVEEHAVQSLSVLFAQIKDNYIVCLPRAIKGSVEKVANKGASILLAVCRFSQVLGNVQGVHLDREDARC